jgi:hypothetical protein
VYPKAGYFDVSPAGIVSVEDNGLTTFKAANDGKHHFLTMSSPQKIRLVEALVQLSSQPPQAGTAFELQRGR